jgi:hypothetical protein
MRPKLTWLCTATIGASGAVLIQGLFGNRAEDFFLLFLVVAWIAARPVE